MNSKITIGAIAIIVGIFYSIKAFQIPLVTMGNPMGPKYFPIALGIAMVVLGIIMFSLGIKEGKSIEKSAETEPKDKNYSRIIVATIVMGIIYTLIFYKIGFVISTLIFLGFLLFMINGVKSWKTNLIITIAFTFGVAYAFEKIFLISLP
jgi:putative tricarboxylic transport membrane protein